MQICIWSSWCHWHSLSLASVKSRLISPFWYQLTQVVQDKRLLNGCCCSCFCVYLYGDMFLIKGYKMSKEWLIASFQCEHSWSATWNLKVHNITGNIFLIRLACFASRDWKWIRYIAFKNGNNWQFTCICWFCNYIIMSLLCYILSFFSAAYFVSSFIVLIVN